MTTEDKNEAPFVDLPPPPNASGAGDVGFKDGASQPGGRDARVVHGCGDERGRARGGGFFAGCFTGCLVAFALPFLLLVLLVAFGVTSAVSSFSDGDLAEAIKTSMKLDEGDGSAGVDEYPLFHEVWSCGEDEEESVKVVRIPLRDEIFFNDGRLKPSAASLAMQMIRRATLDEDVRAIIIEIDSPGGGITASDMLWNGLREFRDADTNRVVIAVMEDICASGGYYVASAADAIVAHPTTITGSIGVIISSVNIKELTDKIGIKDVSIASGENKQMLHPMRDLTDEQRSMLKASVDSLNRRFVQIVAEGRGMSEDEVRKIADGRVFLADEALSLGLVDDIGYFDDALDDLRELLGEDSLHVVRYERKTTFRDIFDGEGLWSLETQLRRLEGASRTRLLYKWR